MPISLTFVAGAASIYAATRHLSDSATIFLVVAPSFGCQRLAPYFLGL